MADRHCGHVVAAGNGAAAGRGGGDGGAFHAGGEAYDGLGAGAAGSSKGSAMSAPPLDGPSARGDGAIDTSTWTAAAGGATDADSATGAGAATKAGGGL